MTNSPWWQQIAAHDPDRVATQRTVNECPGAALDTDPEPWVPSTVPLWSDAATVTGIPRPLNPGADLDRDPCDQRALRPSPYRDDATAAAARRLFDLHL